MNRRNTIWLFLLLALCILPALSNALPCKEQHERLLQHRQNNKKQKEILPYKSSALPIEERTRDLLSRMTLEEKVGQLLCPLGWNMYTIQGKTVGASEQFKSMLKERNMRMLWGTFRADPWTKKTLDNGLNPELAAKAGNALQRYVLENTRLGIPLFLQRKPLRDTWLSALQFSLPV